MPKFCRITKNGKILSDNTKFCNTIFSKTKGLMFSKKGNSAILVNSKESYSGIHMFFVFYPLDIIWLNKDKIVVDIHKNVKPFTPLLKPKKKAKYILELPAGNNTVNIKDKLNFNQ